MRRGAGGESRRVGREIWTVSHCPFVLIRMSSGRAFTNLTYVVQELLRLHSRSQMRKRKSRLKWRLLRDSRLASVGVVCPPAPPLSILAGKTK